MTPTELLRWLTDGAHTAYLSFLVWLSRMVNSADRVPDLLLGARVTWNVQEMSEDALMTLTVANAVVCAAIFRACICRMAVMSKDTTKKTFRANYALLMVASVASGASFWIFGEQPGPGQILLGVAVFSWFGAGAGNWGDGPPPYARYAHLRNVPADQLDSVAAELQEVAKDERRNNP